MEAPIEASILNHGEIFLSDIDFFTFVADYPDV